MNKEQRGLWYRMKVKAVSRDASLSVEARLLWIILESYANMDGTSCHPSVERLMKDTNRCKKWVEKYLRELIQAKRIKIIGRMPTAKGAVNRYQIDYPLTYHYGSQNAPKGMGKKMTHDLGSQNDPQPEFNGPEPSYSPPANVCEFPRPSSDNRATGTAP